MTRRATAPASTTSGTSGRRSPTARPPTSRCDLTPSPQAGRRLGERGPPATAGLSFLERIVIPGGPKVRPGIQTCSKAWRLWIPGRAFGPPGMTTILLSTMIFSGALHVLCWLQPHLRRTRHAQVRRIDPPRRCFGRCAAARACADDADRRHHHASHARPPADPLLQERDAAQKQHAQGAGEGRRRARATDARAVRDRTEAPTLSRREARRPGTPPRYRARRPEARRAPRRALSRRGPARSSRRSPG